MLFDEFCSRNLMRVGISSRVKGAEQNSRAFIALELLSASAVVIIGMRAKIVDTNLVTKGYPLPIVEADGANSSNPAFSFENR
jgi:hypothetical protein